MPQPNAFVLASFGLLIVCVHSVRADEFDPRTTPLQPGLVSQDFIYHDAPFPQCHASTIAETPDGLVAAWFGGTAEKNPDVGIWVSRMQAGEWTVPVEVADGVQHASLRYPCWNPVLFAMPGGELLLFFKVGPSPSTWWGEMIVSKDNGRTWAERRRLPEEILGPVKNKAILVEGTGLLCPTSSEHDGWRVHMEWTTDAGRTWTRTGSLNDGKSIGAIQPAILQWKHGLQIVCRSQQGKISEAWSTDGGRTWSEMTLLNLPNPNSGLDAVTLADGRGLMVYNHVQRGRSPLNVAISSDGKDWQPVFVLEDQPGEYSYPAVIQSSDGLVQITYTWKRRRVKHVVLDLSKLELPQNR